MTTMSGPATTASVALGGQLWAAAAPVYTEILRHPFLTGLADGTLPRESFRAYVIQDVHYIAQFSRVLATVASRAPRREDVAMLTARCAEIAAEHALHQSLLADLAVSDAELAGTPMAPTTRAYTDFLLAVANTRPWADAVAALTACPWVYWEVGKTLVRQGSPDPLYARWIETYGGPQADLVFPPYLELLDRAGAGLGADGRRSAQEHFLTGCRYEWMFWDMGWRRETWPV